jgi:heptosyltransferase-2
MATPVFRQVRQLFPNAKVTALAHEPIVQLLEGIEGIDEFLVFSREKGKKRQEEARIVKELRQRKVDLGLLLTNSLSSAWMFWKGKVRWRVWGGTCLRRFLMNIPVKINGGERHDVLTYGELLRPFGCIEKELELTLKVRIEEQKKMQKLLESLGRSPNEKLVVINPGAAYGSAKCWPKEYFRTVVDALSRSENVCCVFVGDGKSVAMIEEIITGMPRNVMSIAGVTSLRDLMAVISLGDCILTNDSGPMHIAAAFKRPLLAIFGSTNPKRTGPWGFGKVLYKHVACSPCYLRECPIDFRCMRRITPKEVLQNIEQILSL